MIYKNSVLISIICLFLAACTDYETTGPEEYQTNRFFYEVQVFNHTGYPVPGVEIASVLGNRSEYAYKRTDANGVLRVYLTGYVNEIEFSQDGFIQALPTLGFAGAYIKVGDLDQPQIITAPDKEEIRVELNSPVNAGGLKDGIAEEVSIKVISTTRLPQFRTFSSATAYDGVFDVPSTNNTYDCPPIDEDGDVNFSFIKTGVRPAMSIKVRDHRGDFHNQEIRLTP